jgi:hypothetical protein
MKKILTLLVIALAILFACNSPKYPEDANMPASTETPPPPAADTTIVVEKPQ